MHEQLLPLQQHDHVFEQDRIRAGEGRTGIVVVLTILMMIVEIAAGIVFGSMALLADGLHMGSHATALGIAFFAYRYARRHARDPRFSFGTGKVNALGGYTGAVLLVIFTLLMAYESVQRMIRPVPIRFDQAIAVAVLGLVVNGLSALILGHEHGHDHHDDHDDDHHHEEGHHEHDHNLHSAYLHVLADALTSMTAIVALVCGKYFGWTWMDPLMGIVGSLVVARWAAGLLRGTASVLLDRQAPHAIVDKIRTALESEEAVRVTDLHVWSIGPAIYAANVSIQAGQARSPEEYKARLPAGLGLAHVTLEVERPAPDPMFAKPTTGQGR